MATSKFENLRIADFGDVVDVRDGLNPALRTLFFALKETQVDNKFKNSSRWLKDIIGIGEADIESVYDLLVNTAHPRVDLPFIEGHGNFGFPPAYPDFSEMRLSDFGETIIGRGDSCNLNSPFTVPIPYALVCGTLGYNKGETKIPTHNLAEVIDAMIALIKNPKLETKDLLQYIKGPDLLIGGTIENADELRLIYEKGFGDIKVIVMAETFDNYCVSEYCDWYELKFRKVYKKEAYRIEIPYYSFMSDGEKSELMSLKKILTKHLDYYRSYRSELSDEELCYVLTSLKEYSSERKTFEKLMM